MQQNKLTTHQSSFTRNRIHYKLRWSLQVRNWT